jgi:hypothetical protein
LRRMERTLSCFWEIGSGWMVLVEIPHKLEYKTVLYYKVILRYKTVFFGTARERTSILLYKTLFYIRINNTILP